MKRKVLPLMLLTFAFFAMTAVTALASEATIRIEGEFDEAGAFVDVHVYVENISSQGISALVLDIGYTGATRTTGTRTFTANGEVRVLPVTGGITDTNLFDVTGDAFLDPPPAPEALRLYLEMLPGTGAGNTGVLTSGGRAATIRLSVAPGTSTVGITPNVVHAYRWTNSPPFAIRIPTTAITGHGVLTNIGDCDIVWGDADGNGEVDTGDVTRIRQYLVGHPVQLNWPEADAWYDGYIDTGDVTRLRQYLVGHPVILGRPGAQQ